MALIKSWSFEEGVRQRVRRGGVGYRRGVNVRPRLFLPHLVSTTAEVSHALGQDPRCLALIIKRNEFNMPQTEFLPSFLFLFSAASPGFQNLSSLTRDQTWALSSERVEF